MEQSKVNPLLGCIIYHRRDALKIGVAERKIQLLNAWQEASEYSDRERAALAWAEVVTLISGAVERGRWSISASLAP
jgi:AhpD family alkylhydroperoxidase